MSKQVKIIRTATVSLSLDVLLPGQLAFLNNYFEIIACSGFDHHLQNVLEREKVKIKNIQMARPISPLRDFISLIKLYQFFKKEKPQIVHSITPKAGLLSMTAAFFAGVPVRIHTFTGLLFPYKKGIFQWLLLTMDKILCRFATHIIPEGQGVKNDLLAFNVTNKPLEIIAHGNVNGIDVEYFNPEKIDIDAVESFKLNHQLKNEHLKFVYIGRKVKDKGVEELIEAFYQIAKSNPLAKLIFVGPFEETDALSQGTLLKIDELVYKNVIIPFGFKKDIRLFLKVADVLILPSYREGFPNVLLQALSMETPCIATNVSGCNEIIQHGKNGFLIEKQSINELKSTIEKYLSDKQILINQKNDCRTEICDKFANRLVWDALLKFYKKALNDD